MNGERIGIMGGTFDPIHYGHLVTAEAAREKYQLQRVIFVPSGHPPHKEAGMVTDFWHRYLMVLLAVVSNPYFEVSRLEYDRGGVTYTIDTVREFRQRYKSAELFFITGADAILEILTWKRPEELLAMCRFIAATRPGYDLRQLNSLLGEFFQGAVSVLEIPMLNISSSNLRHRAKAGRSLKYLVPEPVEFYILQNGLYRE